MKEPRIVCTRCGKVIKTLVEFTDDEIDDVASGVKRDHYCDYCRGINHVVGMIKQRKSELIYKLTEHNSIDTFSRTYELDWLLGMIKSENKR